MKSVVQGAHYRFTLLGSRFLRMEYDPEGHFEDRPSAMITSRSLPAPQYTVKDDGRRLEIDTARYRLEYVYAYEEEFTADNLIVHAKNCLTPYGGMWRFGQTTFGDPARHNNYFGTARTLDRADGATELSFGLMDRGGRTFFEDNSALLNPDGAFEARRPGTVDVYYVCCGEEYAETLQDFYALSGAPAMLPRYAMGNWWSRYWKYSAEEYLSLTDDFKARDIPFTVGVLDMDWHLTKEEIPPKYGMGWTGYTWNRDLFPDPEGFLQEVRKRGLHVSLNLHPADGVQACEEQYPQMARAMGVDASTEQAVPFDFTDKKFRDAYFQHLMHPMEDMGVDFWWIDWQQGRHCAVPGIDPMLLLNHYHYEDNNRRDRRGMILSRYAGMGGQRYPVGFSGDTVVSWDSLKFQPYFTATAVNVGFPFWSHDIGGFMNGVRDPELFTRWVQLGAFSPILRLHSIKNAFGSKDPKAAGVYAPVAEDFLRLRHRMIPYTYTAMCNQHFGGRAFIEPLYYRHKELDCRPILTETYVDLQKDSVTRLPDTDVRNAFYFGENLMVCPMTSPAEKATGTAGFKAYLPKGLHTDFFTGKTYSEGYVTLRRRVDTTAVLAEESAIVPLSADKGNSVANPEHLEVLIFPGDCRGSFTLYEDDGMTYGFEEGRSFTTTFTREGRQLTVVPQGDAALVPQVRQYTLKFRGFEDFVPQGEAVQDVSYDPETRTVTAVLKPMAATQGFALQLPGAQREQGSDTEQRIFDLLDGCVMDLQDKTTVMNRVKALKEPFKILAMLEGFPIASDVKECITELLYR